MVKYRLMIVAVPLLFMLGIPGAGAGGWHHEDSVCDDADLSGAAYVACVRYCDVMECDTDDPRWGQRACDRTLKWFVKLVGDDPPCDPACPCASGWMAENFVPEDVVAGQCYAELTDVGTLIDVSLEGGPDADGASPWSFASVDTQSDENFGYYALRCISEHYPDENAPLSEDSGFYEAQTQFREPSKRFLQLQEKQFDSCRTILQQIVEDLEIECEVVDLTNQ